MEVTFKIYLPLLTPWKIKVPLLDETELNAVDESDAFNNLTVAPLMGVLSDSSDKTPLTVCPDTICKEKTRKIIGIVIFRFIILNSLVIRRPGRTNPAKQFAQKFCFNIICKILYKLVS